ncbi:MAG: hypothetical protein E7K04_01410 [Helicobacter sp.]|nr:hypothetical protein [Helicobacter sp.]
MKILRVLAAVLFISFSSLSFSEEIKKTKDIVSGETDLYEACPRLEDFTKEQKRVLYDSYTFGESEKMGLILAAIAWHESCAGKYNINFSDPSAGVFHIYIPNALRFKSLKDTVYNRNIMGQMLINDFDLSKTLALNELKLWNAQHRGNIKRIIKSYNKGNSWRRDKAKDALAERYYTEVNYKMRILKKVISDLQKEFTHKDVFDALNEQKKSRKNAKNKIILLEEK